MSQVAVFGAGYVGCVTSACMARDGHVVYAVDVNEDKIRTLASGKSPIREPELEELIASQTEAGRLRPTTDAAPAISDSDVIMIAVGTPSASDGSVNLMALHRVLDTIADEIVKSPKPTTVVIRSTLLPGLLEQSLLPRLRERMGEQAALVNLVNHPEFLRETTAVADYDKPPFIVVGAENESAAAPVFELYSKIESPHVLTDTRTAALVKYVCNAFHALKIGFANEIGTLAHSMGANGQEVMRIACMDTQLNISPAYLRPGFAFGGSCLPKDVRALTRYSQHQALATQVLSSILPSNQSHLGRAMQWISENAPSKKIGIVGLSFKAGTDDLRESPNVTLAESLLGRGYDLRIFDPDVRVESLMGSNLNFIDQHLPHLAKLLVDDAQSIFDHADLLVLATGVANRIDWEGSGCKIYDLRRDLVVA